MPPQDHFEYCFASNFDANARARFRNGVQSWGTRGLGLAATEYPCSNSAALTVRFEAIPGSTIAVTTPNQLGSRVEVSFDSNEVWHTSSTAAPACDKIDLWGVAAHEIGHVYGLFDITGNKVAPEGALKTMAQGIVAYGCPEEASQQRTLSSDDEAGGLWIKALHFMPNFSFERGTCDNISPLECAPNYYWLRTNSSWPRACDANALLGSCYQRMLGTGTIEQTVRRYVCDLDGPGFCQARLSLNWQNRASGNSTIRVRIFDMSADPDITLADTTCLAGSWTWTLCQVDFLPALTTGERAYKYAITNHTTREYWVDYVRVWDW